jgi:hypothetical protein|tara:strand:+ start:415 stop:579 length:165 start_codon:yes stop_codon:yes gene_type:complete
VGKFWNILKPIVIAAAFVNVFLFLFGAEINNYELQVLAIGNMILLSFALLRDEK